LAYFTFVPVSFGTIEVTEAGFEGVFGGTEGYGGVGDECAEPEHGHLAGSVVERDCRSAQVRGFDHDHTSAVQGRTAGDDGYLREAVSLRKPADSRR
jgi:hypothetical protein